MLNKDELKNNLTIEQVFDLVADLGGEPRMLDGYFISRTICHNPAGHGSHKLWYYDNTKLFKCYTACSDTFDVFNLIQKIKECSLFHAIIYIATYFGYSTSDFILDEQSQLEDWKKIHKYETLDNQSEKQQIELAIYDKSILNYLPRPIIKPWEQEGIKREILMKRGIAYDPVNEGIVIPHFDISGNLIGIRERTLIKEEEQYGKYKPAKINGKMYNHPLSFALYNLNNSAKNIRIIKKAIVFESEKSTLLYSSYLGEENDISVACCGSSLIFYQVMLLLSLGVEEIIVAFDRQFQEIGNKEFKKWTKKLEEIHRKYSPYVRVSFIFDKWKMLKYKESPIDEGKDIFLELFNRRIYL